MPGALATQQQQAKAPVTTPRRRGGVGKGLRAVVAHRTIGYQLHAVSCDAVDTLGTMLAIFLVRLIQLYTLLIVVWVVSSWWPPMRKHRLVAQIGRVCEPYLRIFRRLLPEMGGFDFSPLVGILALQLASQMLLGLVL